MPRPSISSLGYYSSGASPPRRQTLSLILFPLILWICVSLSLRYGYYGGYSLVLRANSSRLMEASSVFVEQVQVRSHAKKGFSLYGFLEKPELSLETHWSASKHMFVEPYGHKGFSLWLNKGSRIRMTWKIQQSSSRNIFVVFVKGEHNFQTLMKYPTSSNAHGFMNVAEGNGAAEYTVGEDDNYYVGVVNLNEYSIVMALKVDLSSKMYDTAKAGSQCSSTEEFCSLKLHFPNTQYFILATPNDDDDGGALYVELSFLARLVMYVVILGIAVPIIYLIFKYLGCSENERPPEAAAADATATETEPLMPTKEVPCLYGAIEEDSGASSCSSSSDLYDGKLCVICYDQPRNCFFVPCGHCATCYACAQRIANGENKTCPICRRVIHRIRRLFSV